MRRRLLALPLAVDQVGREVLLLEQHGAAVVQLLLALLALLAHEHLELAQLLPRHLLGVVGVVAHEQQLLVVALLLGERRLEGLDLGREAEPFLLQPVDHLFVPAEPHAAQPGGEVRAPPGRGEVRAPGVQARGGP